MRTATFRPSCPECGERYDARLSSRTRKRMLIGGGAVLVLLIAVLAPLIISRNGRRAEQRAAAKAALVEREVARMQREQRPLQGTGEPAGRSLAARKALVGAVEAAILQDARFRTASGELDGDVREVECGPLEREKEARPDDEDPAKRLGRYDCVAVIADVQAAGRRTVAAFGHPFVASVDFETGSYVWCKDNKNPGERGVPLARVKLAPECLGLDARAAQVGDGYAEPES